MFAEVISIGDELTSGVRLDTNSQWLAQQLGDMGIVAKFHTTVGDELADNIDVFRIASARADIVISTGGLGPTDDDLTRQAIAEAFGLSLVTDDKSLDYIRELFRKRGREMPEKNRVQARFPEGTIVVPNRNGTAPGIDLTVTTMDRQARIFALPGVPAEMKEMWEETVLPRIEQMLGPNRKKIFHRYYHCFGVGESDLESMVPDLIRRGREPQVGITASKATISLRVSVQATNAEAADLAMAETDAFIRKNLGNLIFGHADEELQDIVIRLLKSRGEKLAVIDLATSGMIGQWLGKADSGKEVFIKSLIGFDADSSAKLLRLQRNDIDSTATYRMLAEEIKKNLGVDWVLIVGSLPDEASPEPYVDLFLSGRNTEINEQKLYRGHPELLVQRLSKQALNLIRLTLLESKSTT